MKQVLSALLFLSVVSLAWSSIFPEGETEEQWNQRIQAKIDKNRKSNVQVKVTLPEHLQGLKNLKLQVNNTKASFPLGTALVADRISECWNNGGDNAYCSFARENFNFAVTENAMKWRLWEPEYDNFNSYGVENMLKWLEAKGWGVRAHCLFWDVDDNLNFPDWVYGLRGQEMIDAIHHRIDTAVPYFKGRVQHWDVNNEMLHGNFFAETTYDPDIRVKMFQWLEQQDSQPSRFVNDYDVVLYETDEYINHIRDLLNKGASINGIGFQSHLGPDQIDLGKAEDAFNKMWNEFHLPMWITEFDWQGSHGGDHAQHASELVNFYNLAMSHEGMGGIMMWGFWDQAHWRPDAAIAYGDDVTPNEAGYAYMDLYQNSYRTNDAFSASMRTANELEFNFRGFRGEYELSLVNEHGRSVHKFDETFTIEEDVEIQCNVEI
ncbi:anti-sigma-I factor RsgI6-like [Tigriopus californicus]|uniref:anti-sigma-I factor RsgI6-like n=1 Tax=Tigriopus californicus TaxID=6832 RepID=UPI0027D9FEED|nr:anti-sigma-I factor RsgI6-like [Tigriopus californicus]